MHHSTNLHQSTRGPKPNSSLYIYIFTSTLGLTIYILYLDFNIIKNTDCKEGPTFDFIISYL